MKKEDKSKKVWMSVLMIFIVLTSIGFLIVNFTITGNPIMDIGKQLINPAVSTTAYKEINGLRQNLESFTIPTTDSLNSYSINKEFTKTEIISLNIKEPIKALSLNGNVELRDSGSLVRIILIDSNNLEYLVYESYPQLDLEQSKLNINKVCEETCILGSIIPKSLKIQIENAKLNLNSINYLQATKNIKSEISQFQLKTNQDLYKINKFNSNNLQWTAGATPISVLSYSQKKQFFKTPEGELPNLGGFEYYKGGIFVMPKVKIDNIQIPKVETKNIPIREEMNGITPSSEEYYLEIPDNFDWRNRHGENWVTPVKCQVGCFVNNTITCVNQTFNTYLPGTPCFHQYTQECLTGLCREFYGNASEWRACGSCWIFGPIGAIEANLNLQHNQHLNYDLSEQEILSCINSTSSNGCDGGFDSDTLDYINASGIFNESVYPYKAIKTPCLFPSNTQVSKIRASNGYWVSYDYKKTNYNFKKNIIEKGPISAGYALWDHAMTAVGYEYISEGQHAGKTALIFKNSYGPEFGEEGYATIIGLDDSFYFFSFLAINSSYVENEIDNSQINIICVDKDRDGYCNWGISEKKPITCPKSCREEKDFDDSNPKIHERKLARNYCGDTFILGDEQCETLIKGISPAFFVDFFRCPQQIIQTCYNGWANISYPTCNDNCKCQQGDFFISDCSLENSCYNNEPYCLLCNRLMDGIKNCREFNIDMDVLINMSSNPTTSNIYYGISNKSGILPTSWDFVGTTPREFFTKSTSCFNKYCYLKFSKKGYEEYIYQIPNLSNGQIINLHANLTRQEYSNVAIKD